MAGGYDRGGKNNPRYKTGICMKDSPYRSLYNSWQNMKRRCLGKNHPKYHRYGGRGIVIHEAWLDISGFYEWALKSGYVTGLTIDRIDNDGNYCPENCRWISLEANSRKKSTTKLSKEDAFEIRRKFMLGESEYALAQEYGVVHGTIWFVNNGYTHVKDGECIKRLKARKVAN